jgi:hypothetical protein
MQQTQRKVGTVVTGSTRIGRTMTNTYYKSDAEDHTTHHGKDFSGEFLPVQQTVAE